MKFQVPGSRFQVPKSLRTELLFIAAVLWVSLLCLEFGCSRNTASDPNPPTNTVFRPTFQTVATSFSAGTAFVCEFPESGQHLLLTAHHLFGPDGGLESETDWKQLNQVVTLTVAASLHDPKVRLISKQALLIPGAHALSDKGLNNDIAAFKLDPDSSRPSLKLAMILPKVGERVWLFCQQAGKDNVELVSATVTRSDFKELDYKIERKDFELRATSGAPVLNSEGLVVAVNIGGFQNGSRLIGCGNPSTSVIAHLQQALKQ